MKSKPKSPAYQPKHPAFLTVTSPSDNHEFNSRGRFWLGYAGLDIAAIIAILCFILS